MCTFKDKTIRIKGDARGSRQADNSGCAHAMHASNEAILCRVTRVSDHQDEVHCIKKALYHESIVTYCR